MFAPVRSVVEQLRLGDHVCWPVDGEGDRMEAVATLMAAGIAGGDKVLCLTARAPAALVAALANRGVPVTQAQRSGQVEVVPAGETYLAGGRFDAQRVLDSFDGSIARSAAAGYPGLRVIADMDWVLDGPSGVEDLAGYEAAANRLYLTAQALGVCMYTRRAVAPGVFRQLAAAHPVTAPAGVDPDWAPGLRIRGTVEPYGLRLSGEADLSNRQAVAAALDAVAERRPDPTAPLVVDVAELRFADAGTVALLVRTALANAGGLQLTGCHGEVAMVLDRLGVPGMPGVSIIGAGMVA
jgi:anti-anti-sigma regulatory factor